MIVTPAGLPIFEHGLMAWADVTGAKGVDPDKEGYAHARLIRGSACRQRSERLRNPVNPKCAAEPGLIRC